MIDKPDREGNKQDGFQLREEEGNPKPANKSRESHHKIYFPNQSAP